MPGLPDFPRTITSANPLNAFLSLELKEVISAGSPLSVETISPGPDISNDIVFAASGTITPLLSQTCTVINERS